MRRLIPVLSIATLTSCAIVGTKEVLTVEESSAWKTVRTGHGAYHAFTCGEMPFVSITMNEIVFWTKLQSYGPVIPIIPSGKERNYEESNLTIRIEIVGYSDAINYKQDDLLVHALVNNKELLLADRSLRKIAQRVDEKTHLQWVQYDVSYTYSHKLATIKNLKLQFEYPFTNCAIPELGLMRRTIQDNEFAIAPGV